MIFHTNAVHAPMNYYHQRSMVSVVLMALVQCPHPQNVRNGSRP